MFNSLNLKTKNSLLLIGIIVPLMAMFFTYDLYRQTTSMKSALTRRGVILAQTGAEVTSKILTDAIKYNILTEEQLFDQDYQIIPHTNPPKYHTAYDTYTDQNLRQVEDAFLNDKMIVYAVAVDTKGYLPTHNTKFSKTGGGLGVDRSKRLFDDKVGNTAAHNTKPYLFQQYNRDTGEVMWDISSPVYVNGKQWGAFRIGFSIDETNKTIAGIRNQIIGASITLVLLLIALVIFISHRITDPVRRLAREANLIAEGDLSARNLESKSLDEMGQLISSFSHMRSRLRDLADKTRYSVGLISGFTKELRESTQSASGTASKVASNMKIVAQSAEALKNGTALITETSGQALNALGDAKAQSHAFVEKIEHTRLATTRAGDDIKLLDSQVEKVGQIIQFINILAEQAGQIAEKALKQASQLKTGDSNMKSLAEEVKSRARDVAEATQGVAGLLEGVRDFSRHALSTIDEDHETVMEGKKAAQISSKSLSAIAGNLEILYGSAKDVTASGTKVVLGVSEINSAVEEQTKLVLQFSEIASTLEAITEELEETLSSLKV